MGNHGERSQPERLVKTAAGGRRLVRAGAAAKVLRSVGHGEIARPLELVEQAVTGNKLGEHRFTSEKHARTRQRMLNYFLDRHPSSVNLDKVGAKVGEIISSAVVIMPTPASAQATEPDLRVVSAARRGQTATRVVQQDPGHEVWCELESLPEPNKLLAALESQQADSLNKIA